MNSRNFFRFLLPAVLLLGAVSARTGYADWYHDATTNYLEAASWLEESDGNWHTKPWRLVGGEGDESCCSKSAESDPLYLDGTSGSVSNEIIACRDLTGDGDGPKQGSFHIRADLGDDPDFGFRGFALYDFCDEDDDHPDGVREIIRFGIRGKEELVCRVCGDGRSRTAPSTTPMTASRTKSEWTSTSPGCGRRSRRSNPSSASR